LIFVVISTQVRSLEVEIIVCQWSTEQNGLASHWLVITEKDGEVARKRKVWICENQFLHFS